MPILETRCGGGLPRSPRRGLCPLPTFLRGALPPGTPERGGGVPPTPLLRTETLPRVKAKTRQQRGQKNHRSPPRFAALKRRARRKVLCQAFFQESGGERSVTGAGPSGEILPGPSWTSWPPRRTPRPGASRAPSAAGQIQPFPLAARRSPRGCK